MHADEPARFSTTSICLLPYERVETIDGLGETAEAGLRFAKLLHDGEHVAQGTGEPIEFPDDQDVTVAQLVEQLLQLGSIPPAAGGILAEDAFAAGSVKRGGLDSGVLFGGGNACLAYVPESDPIRLHFAGLHLLHQKKVELLE